MIGRRAFINGTLCLVGTTFSARAQRPPVRIAWLSPTTSTDGTIFFQELLTGLRERGFVDQDTAAIQPFWGEDSPDRVARLVGEVIGSKPDVIVAQGSAALAVKQAKPDIPVVFGYSGDPVQAGLVDSFARPGGKMTGISYLTLQLVGKRMELLKEVLPQAKHVAVLANPQHPGDRAERKASEDGAAAVGLQIKYFEARTIPQQMEALAAIEKAGVDAAMMFPVQNIISNRRAIAEWAIRTKTPTVSGWAQFAEGGNLMSYGPNLLAATRRLAAFAEAILKGTSPAELPVERPTRVELVVNLKAARALGISIPPSVLIRADNVIE
jgi:putative tryptophan/tyrosine transport system substrate-binding protein